MIRAPGSSVALSIVWLLAACYSGTSGGPASDSASGGADTGQGTLGSESGSADAGDTEGAADELPGPNTRLFRLTHAQWENTVRDLFRRSDRFGLSESFRADAKAGPYEFDNSATGLEVDGPLWGQYQRAAVDLAALVVADPTTLAAILPEDTGDETARAREFIRSFGRRAFRRPLAEAEIETYLALFEAGRDLYDDATGFDAGIRAVIEALLQSPHFLYRVEISEEVVGDVIPLGSYEVASRLSYLVWDSMPDDELLDAAEADELRDAAAVETHARRLLADPRADDVVTRFHEVVFDVARYGTIAPNPAFYPDAPADLAELALAEFRRFMQYVVLDSEGGVTDLLTSNVTFANDRLGALYGLDVAGSELTEVELDPQTRRGVLTQIGFLAAHATPTAPDPIHRGKFVATRLACLALPPPPDDIPPLPSPEGGQTNREVIEALTEAPGSVCAGCHATLINPFGWPFEGYDAVGTHRTTDNGFAVDASAEVLLDDGTVAVDGALQLADALAASPAVHACYARYWVSYAAGRWATPDELALVERLGASSREGELSIVDLVVQVATSRPFRNRSTQELDP